MIASRRVSWVSFGIILVTVKEESFSLAMKINWRSPLMTSADQLEPSLPDSVVVCWNISFGTGLRAWQS